MPELIGPQDRFLCAAFLAVALGALPAPAQAVTGRDVPAVRTQRPLPPVVQPPGKGPHCARGAVAKSPNRYGYHTSSTMRRAAALAQVYDRDAITAIAVASYQTGIDFDLMVMKAILESQVGKYDEPILGGRARGLFHFMPATWLTLFSWFGGEFQGGVYADAAAQIKFDADNNPYLDDETLKSRILALRSDHYVAAFIKAKSIRHDERPLMRAILGREPNFTDYYVSHFLGLDRSKAFFRALRRTPDALAADLFPREAADPNNRSIFYKGPRKRTVRQVYNLLGAKVDATLKRLDNRIAAIIKGDSCLPLLVLTPPPRMPLPVSPPAAPPGVPWYRPSPPPEELPMENHAPPAPIPLP